MAAHGNAANVPEPKNVAGIVGLGTAIRIANEEMEETTKRVSAMRDRLIDGILEKIPQCRLNGPRENRLPGNCNISFLGIEGESLLLRLDLAGIAASSGSACASSSLDSKPCTACNRSAA